MADDRDEVFLQVGPIKVPKGVWTDCPQPIKAALYSLAVVVLALVGWQRYGKPALGWGQVSISAIEAAQLIEPAIHINDTPADKYLVDDGMGVVRHYDRHHCTSVSWPVDGGYTRTLWMQHPDRQSTMDVEQELAMLGLSSEQGYAGVGASGGPGPGRCLYPHPPPADEKWQPLNGCLSRVWRVWDPGRPWRCVSRQDYDGCRNVWHPMVWEECHH